jgi:hypothetical protein
LGSRTHHPVGNSKTSFDFTHENWLRSAELEMLHCSFASRKGTLFVSFDLPQFLVQPNAIVKRSIAFEKAIEYCSLNFPHLQKSQLRVGGFNVGERGIILVRFLR